MSTAMLPIDHATILQGVLDIRAAWSPRERHLRAAEGRHRFQNFLDLIAKLPSEPEIRAVGAPTASDLNRLSDKIKPGGGPWPMPTVSGGRWR